MNFLVPYMGNWSREGNLELESEEEHTQDLPQNSHLETDNTETLTTNSEKPEEHRTFAAKWKYSKWLFYF